MKNKNTLLIIAGILNLFTFFLHLIGGQIDLINPLLSSSLESQVQTELLGVWHMVTIVLFTTSIIFLKYGFNKNPNIELITFISYLYIAFSFAFIFSSVFKSIFAPQWILLFPIGILGIVGLKKSKTTA